MHRSFAGGITKLVYHVYAYRDSPTSKWPGYHNFPPASFSNAWGPRNPDWQDARIYNDYLARNAQVLTQGDAKVDVAVYMQNYLYPLPQRIKGGFRMWRDTGLQQAGYTRDYLDPEMLNLANATVARKRLAVDGPAYRAFIVDSEQEPATDPVRTSVPVEVARKILAYTGEGLPVILVGAPPDRTPGLRHGSDEELEKVIQDLLAERNVYRVAHESDVPGTLKSLGIRPAAEPDSLSPMLSVHRRESSTGTDYYFLYNQGVVSPKGEPANLFEPATGSHLDVEVSLEGRGTPYLLDAWSGKIVPIANYTSSADRVNLRVRLSRDDAELIALSEDSRRLGIATPITHVTATTAESVTADRDAVYIGSAKAGTFSTVLSNGRTVSRVISAVPTPIDLTGAKWKLIAEDWQPANPYLTTFGVAAVKTKKAQLTVELDGLKPWPQIPALEHASGIGTYTTSFELPSGWGKTDGARLSLGEAFDSFALTINGKQVPINQLSAEAEVGQYLMPGLNTIAVRVATTLNNRLVKADEAFAQRGLIQPYGLAGPVLLTPYKLASVSKLTTAATGPTSKQARPSGGAR